MLRTALKPRWLALLAVVVVVVVTFTLLGVWQLDVARNRGQADALRQSMHRPVAALTSVVGPQQQFPDNGSGRLVRATGHYDASGQVLVTPRRLHGRSGYWVVTPLVVEGTGARLAVVRGFVTDPFAAAPTGRAPVTVTGTLAPAESVPEDAGLPAGQLSGVDLAVLVNQWPGGLYNAFIFATSEKPDLTGRSPGIQRVPPPPVPMGGLSWRNAAYALQWWLFAVFAVYLWWRTVRDDSQQDQEGDASAPLVTAPGEATHV